MLQFSKIVLLKIFIQFTYYFNEIIFYIKIKYLTLPQILMNNIFMEKKNRNACSFIKGMAMGMMAIILCMTNTSCSKDELDFQKPGDAIKTYRNYLKEVQNTKTTNAKDFCERICKWQELTDTVYKYLQKDSLFKKDYKSGEAFYEIHDSIKSRMIELTETWRCSFTDVVNIKEGSSPLRKDEELRQSVKEATPFFNHLDSLPTIHTDKKTILSQYRQFLAQTQKKGINSTEEMLEYIKGEDILFKSFLEHLIEIDNDPVADITRMTENICRNIFINAKNGKIPAKDAIIYMSMRTGRRLLQNSAVCVKDINTVKMNSKAQGNAYLWMIIQPFISIDQLSIVTLTEREKNTFKYIQEELPKSSAFAKSFNIEQRALTYLLPQQLIKMYILSL